MGWRFRQSVKILPGVRLNVGKRSLGVSVGPRGGKVSLNTKREMRRTVGIPGTGLSHTTQTRLRQSTEDELEQVPVEALTLEELNYLRGRAMRKLVGWGSALVILVLIFAGAGIAAGYLIIPAVVLTIIAPWFARWV